MGISAQRLAVRLGRAVGEAAVSHESILPHTTAADLKGCRTLVVHNDLVEPGVMFCPSDGLFDMSPIESTAVGYGTSSILPQMAMCLWRTLLELVAMVDNTMKGVETCELHECWSQG